MAATDQISDNGTGTTPADVAPSAENSRIGSLDFIRGIAVMGILAANIVAFGQPFSAYMYPTAFTVPHSEFEDWLWLAQFVLIDSKMRGLFSLLFGAGMLLFLDKAWAKGQTRWLQARRLFWLGIFGLIHFFFIWRGDILFAYALVGLVAMAFARMSARKLTVIALVLYALGAVFFFAAMATPQLIHETELGQRPGMESAYADVQRGMDEELADGRLETRIITEQPYAQFVRHNFAEHGSQVMITPLLFLLETLPLMLLGMALYRWGLFEGRTDRARTLKWGWTGVIAGSLVTLAIGLWAKAGGLTYYGTIAAFLGWSFLPRLAVILGLAALLSLLGMSARGALSERIGAAGRAAFSNYLGTSILMLFVFHGWAGGLFGRLGRIELYLVVLATWALMLLWSKPWLERFRFGPLEWLWRCLTYWRLFPLRR